MDKQEAMACAGRLAFKGGRSLYGRVQEAQRRRYFRELAESWELFYDLLDDRPSTEGASSEVLTEREVERLAAWLSPRAILLDLGCGDGSLLRLMARRCASAHGADISRKALARARRACRGLKNVRFYQVASDALEFPDGSFDLVLFHRMLAFLDLEPAVSYVREACRILKPGGRLIFDVPDLLNERYLTDLVAKGGGNWPMVNRPRFWTVEMARALVPRCGFRIEDIRPGPWFEVNAVKASGS